VILNLTLRAVTVLQACVSLMMGLGPLMGCSERVPSDQNATQTPRETPSFVDKVWRVEASNAVAPGQLYVFLSEGTLVIASDNGTPALGRWKRESGNFTMVEDGVAYPVEILELTDDRFRIRMKNPGEPVEMTLVNAAP
jgi:hypothetical protein